MIDEGVLVGYDIWQLAEVCQDILLHFRIFFIRVGVSKKVTDEGILVGYDVIICRLVRKCMRIFFIRVGVSKSV